MNERENRRGRDEAAGKDEVTREIKAKGRMDAKNSRWVSEFLAAGCRKKHGATRNGRRQCSDGTIGCMK